MVGDQEARREVEIGEDTGNEPSELESSMVEAMEENEETGSVHITNSQGTIQFFSASFSCPFISPAFSGPVSDV